jgi:signal transduction histidine kinase
MIGPARRRWALRTRLTAVYSGLLLLAGAAVLAITYLLLQQTLQEPFSSVAANDYVDSIQMTVNPTPDASIQANPGSIHAGGSQAADDSPAASELNAKNREAQKYQADLRKATLQSLLTRGALALALVGTIAVWLGWLIAGRTLRPLQQVTATARRVADHNLHERIGLQGPRDELKELADTFDSMLQRLDRAFDGQRRFVANASHELRTPLAINRTILEVTLARPDTSAYIQHVGTALLEVNARHERLIEGLLTLARSDEEITNGRPVDVADVARHVIEEIQAHNAEGSHPVEIVSALAPAPTVGDAVLLERLAQNLVQNASLYNNPGGSVKVTTLRTGPSIELTVTNTGPVIPAYEIPNLFEPFRRLVARAGSPQGIGLGLSIVAAITRAHGGQVHATPRDGGGLTVKVLLPAQPADQRQPDAGAGDPSS